MSTEPKGFSFTQARDFDDSRRLWVARPADPARKIRRIVELHRHARSGLISKAAMQKLFDELPLQKDNPHTLMGFWVKPTDPKKNGTYTDEDGKYLGDVQDGDSLMSEEFSEPLRKQNPNAP